MNDEGRKEDSFVGELLEVSLTRHRSEAPRPGLEGRILAGVHTKEQAIRRTTWLFAFGAVAATVVVISAAFFVTRRPPAPASPLASKSAPSRSVPPVASLPPENSPLGGRRGLVARTTPRPGRRAPSAPRRPEQFPTPAPLSEQEKLLLAYVSQAPKSELSKPILPGSQIVPLKIPELKIAMIEIKELPGPTN
jgi:hypothetical protein